VLNANEIYYRLSVWTIDIERVFALALNALPKRFSDVIVQPKGKLAVALKVE